MADTETTSTRREQFDALHGRLSDVMCTLRTVRKALGTNQRDDTMVDATVVLDATLDELMEIYNGIEDLPEPSRVTEGCPLKRPVGTAGR